MHLDIRGLSLLTSPNVVWRSGTVCGLADWGCQGITSGNGASQ